MREYENNRDFSRRRQRQKAKQQATRKCILLLCAVCGCLAVITGIVCLLGTLHRTTANQAASVSNPGTDRSEAGWASDAGDRETAAGETNSGGAGDDEDAAGKMNPDDTNDGEATAGKMNSDDTNGGNATADETSWCLILANRWNPIPDNYQVELITLSNGESVDTRIYSALQEMFDSARNQAVYPIVASGYRTAEKQQSLMDEKITDYENEGYSPEEAKTKAEAWVAIPGTSEHQLGIAVDINADGIQSTGDEVYAWLDENAYKFGFIRRYPSDKTEITGVINEPWHYRYVGIAAAADIQNRGICLEEYLDKEN